MLMSQMGVLRRIERAAYFLDWRNGRRRQVYSSASKGKIMKILIADKHVLFREGLHHILAQRPICPTILEVGNFEEAAKIAKREPPIDIVLLGPTMRGAPGHHELERLCRSFPPQTHVVIISASDDRQEVSLAINLGVSGFIPKTTTSKVFLAALDLIMAGGTYLPMGSVTTDGRLPAMRSDVNLLTTRQKAVLELIKLGMSNSEIAGNLKISVGTTRLHVAAILKQLHLKSRTQAALVTFLCASPHENACFATATT